MGLTPKQIDFAKEARDLQVAMAEHAYPAADGSADIDNHSRPIIEVTLREIARRAVIFDRSSVREILTGVADEHVHITEVLLMQIDKLPIGDGNQPSTPPED